MTYDDDIERLMAVCDRMHHRMIQAEMERRGLDQASHPEMLIALDMNGHPLPQNRLADMLGVSAPSAAVSIQRMEKAGLLARLVDEGDQRRKLVSLTDKGRSLIRECRDAFDDIDRRMFEDFSEEDRNRIKGYYLRMIENLITMGAQAPVDLVDKESS